MTKKELVAVLSERLEIKHLKVEEFLEKLADIVNEEIIGESEMTLPGIGIFKVKERAARMGRNPKTGEEIKIPSKKVISFKAAKSLRDSL